MQCHLDSSYLTSVASSYFQTFFLLGLCNPLPGFHLSVNGYCSQTSFSSSSTPSLKAGVPQDSPWATLPSPTFSLWAGLPSSYMVSVPTYMLCPRNLLISPALFPVPDTLIKQTRYWICPLDISKAPHSQHIQNQKCILSPRKPILLAGLPQSTLSSLRQRLKNHLGPHPQPPARACSPLNPDSSSTCLFCHQSLA